MSTSEKKYPPVRNEELEEAFRHLRKSKTYRKFMPPPRTLQIDWFLLRAIANEVARRRTPAVKLMFLTGTVVREFVPDVNPATRELGNAYKSAMSLIFRNRKLWQTIQRDAEPATEHPVAADEQLRLV